MNKHWSLNEKKLLSHLWTNKTVFGIKSKFTLTFVNFQEVKTRFRFLRASNIYIIK